MNEQEIIRRICDGGIDKPIIALYKEFPKINALIMSAGGTKAEAREIFHDALMKYIDKNLVYPDAAKEGGISGTVYVSFVVETDGTIKNAQIPRGIGGGCDDVALELVKSMPKWIPGQQRNRVVPVQYTLSVQFVLP